MVTADVDRDYYADLDLKPSAEPNDIKKAFKKLGMLVRSLYAFIY